MQQNPVVENGFLIMPANRNRCGWSRAPTASRSSDCIQRITAGELSNFCGSTSRLDRQFHYSGSRLKVGVSPLSTLFAEPVNRAISW
jgi:hypothetical protein